MRADQPIRQWTILKLLESNGRVTLRQIADALSETCHERTLRGAGGGDRAGAIETDGRMGRGRWRESIRRGLARRVLPGAKGVASV
ncbi:MAG: hypothetical protein MPW15_13980 [Candidatus Manganitrophus sp.]|nr:hypothetical protein [Candidatus Manganitrophus sp.]